MFGGVPQVTDFEGVRNILGAAHQWAALKDRPIFDTERDGQEVDR